MAPLVLAVVVAGTATPAALAEPCTTCKLPAPNPGAQKPEDTSDGPAADSDVGEPESEPESNPGDILPPGDTDKTG